MDVLRKVRGEGLRKQLDLLVSAKLIDAKDFCQRQADYVMEVFVARCGRPSSRAFID